MMIIHPPEITREGGELCISSKIEMQTPLDHYPERLWYRFPESYRGFISPRSDAFLTSLILPAMHFGEDLEVRGAVSPKLAGNLPEFQRTQQAFWPKLLRTVDIKCERLEASSSATVAEGVATAFSGGVDSSYTLWMNRPENQPDAGAQITHGVFVHGFDIFLYNQPLYQSLYRKYQMLFRDLGLELLEVRTNVYQFTEFRIPWTRAFSPALIASAMVFGPLLRKFYVPAGDEIINGKVMTPNLVCVPLLSTETLETELYGHSLQRIDKLVQMADWPFIHDNLRVCMDPMRESQVANCHRCIKCLNTLVYLEVLNITDRFTDFKDIRFNYGKILRLAAISLDFGYYRSHLPRYALAYGRYDIWACYWLLLIPTWIKSWVYNAAKALIPAKIQYQLKRKLFPSNRERGPA